MKIAFLCDTHLPESKNSPQYEFFRRAVEQMHRDGVNTVVNLGDINSFGEIAPFEGYIAEMSDFESYYVFGNSEVRDPNTLEKIMSFKTEPCFKVGNRTFLGINTPYADIDEDDRARLEGLKDGDVVFLHHYVRSLHKDSREFFEDLLARKRLTVFHGHAHYYIEDTVGKSRVYGLRALDPDKSIGNYPCITYAEVTNESITLEEKLFDVGNSAFDVKKYFGISCVNNEKDVSYAICNGIRNLEIRCRSLREVDYSIIQLVEKWRAECGCYLSLHMPDVKYCDGEFSGEDKWYAALEFAKALGVNGITIHPPVASRLEMKDNAVYDRFLKYYVEAVIFMGDSVKIGIENMHMSKGEVNDESCRFGVCPEEVAEWIDAINQKLGCPERVGHTLDVGHARNNGIIASTNPVGRWYEKMGKRTVAYHIHQVVSEKGEVKNHSPISNWFGPIISYVSFLYAWETKMINNVPVFFEVRGAENYEISTKAFEKAFLTKA